MKHTADAKYDMTQTAYFAILHYEISKQYTAQYIYNRNNLQSAKHSLTHLRWPDKVGLKMV